MKSKSSKRFWRLFHALPSDVRTEARRAFKAFRKNSSDSNLHFKQVVPSRNYWSIQFGESYRAIGIRQGANIEWIWIGDHTEYEQIIHGTHRQGSTPTYPPLTMASPPHYPLAVGH